MVELQYNPNRVLNARLKPKHICPMRIGFEKTVNKLVKGQGVCFFIFVPRCKKPARGNGSSGPLDQATLLGEEKTAPQTE